MKKGVFGLLTTNFLLDPIFDADIFINRDELRKNIETRINRSLVTESSANLVLWG